MSNVGRLCVKIAGREAGKKCVVVDEVSNSFVLIDGDVKRRKCNINHLEFLNEKVKIKKNAASDEVKKALKEIGVEVQEMKEKKEVKEKPKKVRKVKEKVEVEEKKEISEKVAEEPKEEKKDESGKK
ncbi:50S ribosomal protein L14e [archaeon]|nr:50S ribosomal protein L14e [archaeon]